MKGTSNLDRTAHLIARKKKPEELIREGYEDRRGLSHAHA
jgi:hypothetical protein